METRLAGGGNKVIKEIIDLRLLPLLQMLAVIVLPPPQHTSLLCGYLMKVQSLWRQNLQMLGFLTRIKSYSLFSKISGCSKK